MTSLLPTPELDRGDLGDEAPPISPVFPDRRPPAPEPIRWRILGPLRARRAGVDVAVGPPRQRMLLLLLLAHAGEFVSMSTIIEVLWPRRAPTYAANVVHKHVGTLRRIVDPDLPRRAQGDWLLSDGGRYRVRAEPSTLDLLEFRRLMNRARDSANPSQALDAYLAGFALWGDYAARDVPAELAGRPTFQWIEQEYSEAVRSATELALITDRIAELRSPLRLACRLGPLDENLHTALIRSLCEAGQRSEAAQSYEAMRVRLRDTLQVEPAVELERAFRDLSHPGGGHVASDPGGSRSSASGSHPARKDERGMAPSSPRVARGRPSLVEDLGLHPYPRGGWSRETWRVRRRERPAAPSDGATCSVAYLFLTEGDAWSWHRVPSMGIVVVHEGDLVLELGGGGAAPVPGGTLRIASRGQHERQAVIPPGTWYRSRPVSMDTLVTRIAA